jgi:hypothetical protein
LQYGRAKWLQFVIATVASEVTDAEIDSLPLRKPRNPGFSPAFRALIRDRSILRAI